MPEGDTVFLAATRLRAALAGQTLTRTDFRVPRFATVSFAGRAVDVVTSHGKHLLFRIGGGVQVDNGLEIAFYYSYLHDASRGGVMAPDGGILFATLTHPGTLDQVSSAFAATSFNYNLYDIEFARTFKLADCFALRLFGGSPSRWRKRRRAFSICGTRSERALR